MRPADHTDHGLAGFWISCAASFLALFVLAFASPACRTQKTTATTATGQSETHGSAAAVQVAHTIDWSSLLMSWLSDSVTVRLTADSIVAPDGTTVIRPVIDTSVSKPRIDIAKEAVRHQDDSLHADVSASTVAAAAIDTATSADTVAVAEPPDWRAWLILVAVVAIGAVGLRQTTRSRNSG